MKTALTLKKKYVAGINHPRFYRNKIKSRVLALIVKNPTLSVTQIAKNIKAGRHATYSLLKDLKLTTEVDRLNFSKLYVNPRVLDTNIKISAVRNALDKKESLTSIAKNLNIARKTLYAWIGEYKSKGQISEDYVRGFEHPRSLGADFEKKVLSFVIESPNLSIHAIAKSLNHASHGVYNVLLRNNLNFAYQRVAYAQSHSFIESPSLSQSQVYSSTGVFDRVRSVFDSFTPNLSPAPPPVDFAKILFGTTAISSLLFYSLLQISSFGMALAMLALATGMFFFVYSLKYYMTLGLVLSYSQNDKKETKKDFVSWILGRGKARLEDNDDIRSIGLNPDMDSITLRDKPFVSVHIALFNEKNVVERIAKAVSNFDYPEYEVILADDSTDETTMRITRFQEQFLFKGEKLQEINGEGWYLRSVEVRPGVYLRHLHRQTRDGYKGKALDLALKLTDKRAKYISIFDADFVPYPDSLTLFLKYFQSSENKSVAAVQGYQWHVLNKSENWITRGVRSEYSGSYVVERSGAEIYGGLKQISGSVYMIKKDVLAEIGWGTSITEDFELTLKLYEKGYKVLYTPYVQAPAECVSTLQRLIRQRMRWAEGHSFNVKKMFKKLLLSPNLTRAEKLEFLYLTPYYLQAFFFLVGTFAWLISETIFRTKLPFWTQTWGWSLVLTNMISLPLVNAVGLFMEESEKKDYSGIWSFIALSYIVVPFQAFAAVKGFIEKEEGPWFRTPKTGKITDIFRRSGLARFVQELIPVKQFNSSTASDYLALNTSNNQFNNFNIKKQSSRRWLGKAVLSVMLAISVTITSYAPYVDSFITKDVSAFGLVGQENKRLVLDKNNSDANDPQNGVLAINTDKSVYKPNDTVRFEIGVLDYLGKMVCDAQVQVSVKTPSGKEEILSTKNGGVIVNGSICQSKGVTDDPDYEAKLKVSETGKYSVLIESEINGIELWNKNTFEVQNYSDFEIGRITATRVNPKNTYKVNINVWANKDFKGIVKETLPENFKVLNNQSEWKVDWKKGNWYSLSYEYDAPDASPKFYTLGPLKIGKYIEKSTWGLAIDALTVVYLTSGTSWAVPSDWNNSVNIIEVIGGGAGGASGSTTNAGGGGGGGGYSMKRNVTLSGTVGYAVGASVAANTNGNDTYFCNSTSNCGAIGQSAVQVGAKGGTTGGTTTSGTATAGGGGAAANGVGELKRSGGSGGTGTAATPMFSFGGGGGAGGPRGAGANGGNGDTSNLNDDGGGGGGGSGGGANGSNGGTAGGAGGGHIGTAGSAASEGGTAGNNATNPTSGSNGGGGGGADETGTSSRNGANGSNGTEYDSTPYGAGGGGGASSSSAAAGTQTGGNGGNYGAGGGAGETGGTGAAGLIVITYLPATTTTIFLTAGTTSWTVPADWDSSANIIEVIGGGAGGRTDTTDIGGGGGGGGAFALTRNVSLTAGASITVSIGASVGAGTAGNATYFNGASCSASSVCGAGGSTTTTATGGAGGTNANGLGILRFEGGTGGAGSTTGDTGGGGGGAGGPHGTGATGGVGTGATNNGGGGGGGAGGGAIGGASGAGGGTGGNGYGGSGGGAGGTGANGTKGTDATGGGGGGADTGGFTGGIGGYGSDWDSTHGSGGGGGGTASSGTGGSGTGGAGGNYGGGGGGGGATAGGGGAAGIIAITYRRSPSATTSYSFQRKTWYDGTRYWRSFRDVSNSRIEFQYSTDGSSWTEDTSARIATDTNDFSIEADSSNVFIVYSSGNSVMGRAGSSYPGTGFSWGSEQTIFTGTSATDHYDYPVIKRDSSNYIFVASRYTGSGVYYIKAIKETGATNDLPEDSGDTVSSLADTSNTNSNVYASLNPLTSQNMYITFVYGTALSGCKWLNASTAWQNSSGGDCTGASSAAWYNASWNYRTKLTIDHTKLSADLTDYTIYTDLANLPAGFHTNVNQTDARDIRVTKSDGTTELPREVVFYDSATNTGELHFKYSGTLSSSVDTDVYVYYGNSGASDYAANNTYGSDNAWDSNYQGIYHLSSSSGTSASDSTSHGYDSSSFNGSPTWTNSTKVGRGLDFASASDEWVTVPDNNDYDEPTNNFTACLWIKPNTTGPQYSSPLTHRLSTGSNQGWQYRWSATNTMQFNIDFGTPNTNAESASMSTGTWYYMCTAVNRASNMTMYIDGSSVSTPSISANSAADISHTDPLLIGAHGQSSSTYDFDGLIDEVTISSTDRSADWITATYNNQNSPSTFFSSFGTEEAYGSTAGPDAIATVVSGLTTGISSVADASGNVHLVYINSSNQTTYQERTTSWQTAVILDSNSGNSSPTITYDSTTTDVYAFWIRAGHIYYKKGVSGYTSGSWDTSATDWKSTFTNSYVSSNYSGASKIFAQWTEDSGVEPPIDWDILPIPELLWLFFGIAPLIPLLSKLRKKKYATEKAI